MTSTRWLIISFWVFVAAMLAWQAYTYEINSEKELAAHPKQQHFFFDPAMDPKSDSGPNPNLHAANVRQIAYSITYDSTQTSFVAHSTLKNLGNAKAVAIQIWIRPYRGVSMGGSRGGDVAPHQLSDDDPISQMGQWVSIPDLAPGETYVENVNFVSRPDVKPGANPNPQIVFETEKPAPEGDSSSQ